MKYLIAYVPVLHGGYLKLFKKTQGTLYLVGPEFVSEEFPRLIRDLRQVPVKDMVCAVEGLAIFEKVEVLSGEIIEGLQKEKKTVVMPDEEISRQLAQKYFSKNTVVYENVFLRWDKPITLREQIVSPDRVVSKKEVDKTFIQLATEEANKSADWWRQVGVVAVREGKVLFTGYNKNLPTEYNVHAVGNPRDNFDAGEHSEIYSTIHGEASVVAQSAQSGVSLQGAEIYVTTFPCANCARLLSESGIVKVYYKDGYSMLDAEDIFKANNIEIVLVKES
jgi:dCMP deaminase